MMILDRTVENEIIKLRLLDDAKSPLTGVTFDDADLTLQLWSEGDTAWATQNLASGTVGTYLENGWAEVGEGVYEWGLPNVRVVSGQRLDLRVKYAANRTKFESIHFLTTAPVADVTFNITAPGAVTLADGVDTPIYIKETGVVVTFTADVDISATPLKVIFEDADEGDIVVVADGDLVKSGTQFTLTLPSILTNIAKSINWAVRHATTKRVYGAGSLTISYAPYEDTV